MDSLIFEIRQLEDPSRDSPGRLSGTLLVYEERARDRNEIFATGRIEPGLKTGILVNWQHDRSRNLLKAIPFEEDGAVSDRRADSQYCPRPRYGYEHSGGRFWRNER